VTLAWARAPQATWLRWSRATAWGVFLSIPIIAVSYIQDRQVSWIPPATFSTVRVLYENFFGPGTTALWISLGAIATCLAAAVVAERHTPGVTLTRLALPILIVSPMLLIGESMVTKPLYGGIRYVVWALPAMALLVGAGLDVLVRAGFRGRALAIGVVAGLAVLAASLSSNWALQKLLHTPAGSPQDLLAAASYLHEHAQPGDGVIFLPRSLYAVELGYPHDVTALRDLVLKHSPRASGTLYGSELNRAEITHAVDASSRIWYVATGSPYHSNDAGSLALITNFRRVSVHGVKGSTISLWVHLPRAP
jgi:mannosyltransferase